MSSPQTTGPDWEDPIPETQRALLAAKSLDRVADALATLAEAEFASWLKRQSDEVRAMTEAEQVEIWAEDCRA